MKTQQGVFSAIFAAIFLIGCASGPKFSEISFAYRDAPIGRLLLLGLAAR